MGLEARKRILENQINKAVGQLAYLESLPEDDFPNGSIITFEKQFGNGERAYIYVALKVDNSWYISSLDGAYRRKWEELLEFMSSGVEKVWYATQLEEVEGLGKQTSP